MSTKEFFAGLYSTDEIWRGTDTSRCLTDELNAIDDLHYSLPSTYAAKDHAHSDYAAKNHTHTGYAATNHTHDDYADKNHTHDDYFSVDGGTVNGDTNIAGILRVNGQQSFYYKTDTQSQTVGTNNAIGGTTICCGANASVALNGASTKTPTIIPRGNNAYYCGNSSYRWKGIYSASAVNVSSDERLKENVKDLNPDDAAKLIDNISVKSFNYIDDDEPMIGVVAQDIISASPELAKVLVSQDEEDGYYGVKTSDLVFPLISVVQQLTEKVNTLTEEVDALAGKSVESAEEADKETKAAE